MLSLCIYNRAYKQQKDSRLKYLKSRAGEGTFVAFLIPKWHTCCLFKSCSLKVGLSFVLHFGFSFVCSFPQKKLSFIISAGFLIFTRFFSICVEKRYPQKSTALWMESRWQKLDRFWKFGCSYAKINLWIMRQRPHALKWLLLVYAKKRNSCPIPLCELHHPQHVATWISRSALAVLPILGENCLLLCSVRRQRVKCLAIHLQLTIS